MKQFFELKTRLHQQIELVKTTTAQISAGTHTHTHKEKRMTTEVFIAVVIL